LTAALRVLPWVCGFVKTPSPKNLYDKLELREADEHLELVTLNFSPSVVTEAP